MRNLESRQGGINRLGVNYVASGVLDSIGFQKQKGTRGASFIYAKNTNRIATGCQTLWDSDLHSQGPFLSLVFLLIFTFMNKYAALSENSDLRVPRLDGE